jgi:hypothetical protein
MFQLHYNFMGPPLYMWYAIDQNIVIWHTTIFEGKQVYGLDLKMSPQRLMC